MPVNTPSDDYMQHAGQWTRIRDALEGEDAVKAKARTYLRAPDSMHIDDFAQYSKAASWFPASARTLAGLTGAIFRKAPQVEYPDDSFLENVTRTGVPFVPFSQHLTSEVIGMGRAGVLVDVPQGNGSPYLCLYSTENIINVRSALVDGRPQITMIVLKEKLTTPREEDRFSSLDVERYRVLELARSSVADGPVYTVSVFEKQQHQREEFKLVAGPIIPTKRGQPLPEIPFTFFGPTSLEPGIEQSPILGLVDTNFSHFRTSAEHENSLWFAGTPQFIVAGGVAGGERPMEMTVGAGTVWFLEKEAKAWVLQGAAENIGAIAETMKDKESRMAVLGARLLETQQRGNPEHHLTVDLRHRGEDSILANVSQTISRGLTRVLKTAAEWSGQATDKISVSLNTDFVPAGMAPKDVLGLVSAWQTGGIGGKALFLQLQRGETIPADWSFDDFLEDIEINGSFMGRSNFELDEKAA